MKSKTPKKKATHTMPDGKVMAGASHKSATKKKPAKKGKYGY